MFLRYTDLGVGHPITLRSTVRDCFGSRSRAPVVATDIDEGGSDDEGCGDDDEQHMHVDLQDDEEPEDEGDDMESEEDAGESDDGVDDLGEVDEDDNLSF